MLKLILADNQAIFRAGIAKVLAVEDEMRIVAQAQTLEQMFMALDKFRAAVLVVAGRISQRLHPHRAGSEPQQDAGGRAGRYRGERATIHGRGRKRRGLSQRDQRGTGRLRPQSCSRRNLGAGCRRTQRTHRERYGRIAGPRPSDRERAAHRGPDRAGIQEQGNRLATRNDRAGHQELPAQRLRQDRRVGPAGTGAVHDPSPDPE